MGSVINVTSSFSFSFSFVFCLPIIFLFFLSYFTLFPSFDHKVLQLPLPHFFFLISTFFSSTSSSPFSTPPFPFFSSISPTHINPLIPTLSPVPSSIVSVLSFPPPNIHFPFFPLSFLTFPKHLSFPAKVFPLPHFHLLYRIFPSSFPSSKTDSHLSFFISVFLQLSEVELGGESSGARSQQDLALSGK